MTREEYYTDENGETDFEEMCQDYDTSQEERYEIEKEEKYESIRRSRVPVPRYITWFVTLTTDQGGILLHTLPEYDVSKTKILVDEQGIATIEYIDLHNKPSFVKALTDLDIEDIKIEELKD